MNEKVNNFFKDNAKAIIAAIFFAGGIATTITMQGVRLEKVEENEKQFVTYAVLELKLKAIDAQMTVNRTSTETLTTRVRNAIDNDIKPVINDVNELKCRQAVTETIVNQHEEELTGVWKFINKFLERLK